MRNVPPRYLLPGTVVAAHMKGWLGLTRHFGLVTRQLGADGLPIMVANSMASGGPAEESWEKFTEGKGTYTHAYYPSGLAADAVLANAYRMFGTRYHLLKWNCEHFVNASHGLPVVSRQVGRAQLAFVAIAGGLALAAARG